MTTGFYIRRSSDSGAAVLSGQAGALLGVIDDLLQIGTTDALWDKVYTGTNKAVYRAQNGDRFYLRVDDSNAQYGAVRGYATMSDVDTGTSVFPTTTQQTNWSWFKSNTANSTARTWVGVATDRFFLLLVSGGWGGTGQDLYFFGDIKKSLASDVGATVLKAHPATTIGADGFTAGCSTTSPYAYANAYTAAANNTGQMMPFAKSADGATAAAAGLYFGPLINANVPFGTYGEILCIPICVGSSVTGATGRIRGTIPHVYFTPNNQNDANLALGDTFSDTDGRTYQLCSPNGTGAANNSIPFVAILTSDSETGTV